MPDTRQEAQAVFFEGHAGPASGPCAPASQGCGYVGGGDGDPRGHPLKDSDKGLSMGLSSG